MASDSRALTLKLLADTADFQKKLAAGSKDIDSIGERASEFGKKAAAAFAAVTAAAGAFAISAIKNAAEDEAAQRTLALTIENSTNAKREQIAAVEQYITKTSLAVGVTDDQLRPAFARLVRSTKDVEDATTLLNLALDISAATGKPLETVSMALGKAYDGNAASLGRLGLGVDANILKSKDFNAIFQELTKTFGNFAENEANSTEKQMERVKIALDEAKESIGGALLPVVQELTTWLLQNFVPALDAFISGLTGSGGLNESLNESQETAFEWGEKLRGFIETVIELKDQLIILAGVLATVFVVNKIAAAVTATIVLINGLIKAYNALKGSAIVAGVAQAFALNPALGVGAAALAAGVLSAANAISGKGDTPEAKTPNTQDYYNSLAGVSAPFAPNNSGGGTTTTSGVFTSGGVFSSGSTRTGSNRTQSKPTPTLIEQVTQANFIKSLSNPFDVAAYRRGEESDRIVININGAIDPESTARQIKQIINSSSYRGGIYAE